MARQERLRKQNQSPPGHVYTEEDLSRPQILVPEDRQHVDEARKNRIPAGPEEKADAGQPAADPASLGEIARRYRVRKEKNEQEAASSVPLPIAPIAVAAPAREKLPKSQETLKQLELAGPHPFPVVTSLVAPDRSNVPRSQVQAAPKWAGLATSPRATPAAEPQPRRTNAVRLRAGDTLWGLAKVYLGAGRRWPRLLAANPNVHDPRRIPVSTWIFLPTSEDVPPDEVRLGRSDGFSRSLFASRKTARIGAKVIETTAPLAKGQFRRLAGKASEEEELPGGSSRRVMDRSEPTSAVFSPRE